MYHSFSLQITQYHTLKKSAGAATAAIQTQIDELEREQRMDSNDLTNERRRLDEKRQRIAQKEREKDMRVMKIASLTEQLEQMQSNIDDERATVQGLDEQVGATKLQSRLTQCMQSIK